MSEQLGRQELVAANCARIADSLLQQERPSEAEKYAHRAVTIIKNLGSPDLVDAGVLLAECNAAVKAAASC